MNGIKSLVTGDIGLDQADAGSGSDSNLRIMLVSADQSATATPKQTHAVRTDINATVSNYEITGTGYTTLGKPVVATVAFDSVGTPTAVEVSFAQTSWTSSTITARGAIIFYHAGSTPSASTDKLLAYLDFGANVSSSNGTFTVSVTTPLSIDNS